MNQDFGSSLPGNLNDSSPEEPQGTASNSSPLTIARKPQTSTRVSLLVEALVRNVVTAYETDGKRAKRSYRKICRNLNRMGLIDESWSMTELDGARVQFEHALFKLLDDGGSIRRPSARFSLPETYYTSQYKREFDEFEKIGKGAFGKVFRVKHKLDSAEYAVKKIPIYSEGLDSVKNCLAEVKTFASLNHPNIVQYKAAWLELGPPSGIQAISNPKWGQSNFSIPSNSASDQFPFQQRGSNFQIQFAHESNSDDSPSKMDLRNTRKSDQIPSNHVVPVGAEGFLFHKGISISSLENIKADTSSNSSSNSNFEIAFEASTGNNYSNAKSHSVSEKFAPTEKAIVPAHQNGSIKPRICWATLYIQMALCHGTLDQWLRRRNESFNAEVAVIPSGAQMLRTKAIKQILVQILRGLEYIHSKGVVHHDIKPSNIFVSAQGRSLLVQLGDFGLACPLQRGRHCFARGTPLYAAPEQLAGRCDSKSDIYSVGIVLFELLEDFGTDMERTRRISELRARADPPVPSDFSLNNLVAGLVRRRLSERPDASTLLSALEDDRDVAKSDVSALQQRVEEQEREIERLKELLRKHGVREF